MTDVQWLHARLHFSNNVKLPKFCMDMIKTVDYCLQLIDEVMQKPATCLLLIKHIITNHNADRHGNMSVEYCKSISGYVMQYRTSKFRKETLTVIFNKMYTQEFAVTCINLS